MRTLPEAACMILSGGSAERAGGVNKSLIMVDGRAIIEHQMDRLRGIFSKEAFVVVTDRPGDYSAYGMKCVGDVPGEGGLQSERSAMRGVHSALAQCPAQWAFVLANDMPWPNAELARKLFSRLHDGGVLGACIALKSGLEPMHAVYHRSLAGELEARIAEGRFSLQEWLAGHPQILRLESRDFALTEAELAHALANFNTVSPADRRAG